ncbi:MAG: hypothetical protein HY304_06065 [candidate division Zixibacteria bacterium]|nr:hypothetical protein [candidate division Zixibacteria bacterium]
MRGTKLAAMVAVLAAVATAFAGQMTPQELATKMANCPSCKTMVNYPELGPNVRADVFETANGYVSTFLMADSKALPACAKWSKDCETAMAGAAKMSRADFEKTFCPYCVGMSDLMARKDVKMESFNGSMGKITVATATTKEGLDACHVMVKTMKDTYAVVPLAMAEMMKNAKPKTAEAGQ